MENEFIVENGKFGKCLVVTSKWNKEYENYLIKHNIKELNLNYARGWIEEDIYFLKEIHFLEGLSITAFEINISQINDLHALRTLSLSTFSNSEIDFNNFPNLEDCFLEWRSKTESIFNCITLKRLCINQYKGKDTSQFARLTNLNNLRILNSPIRSLEGLASLKKLVSLEIANFRKLESLKGIETLTQLEELQIHGCKKIDNIELLARLTNLKILYLCNVGMIDNIKPLLNLKELEQFIFYEDTNIADGDLTPLTKLPKLNYVAFQNRKHYSHKREMLPS